MTDADERDGAGGDDAQGAHPAGLKRLQMATVGLRFAVGLVITALIAAAFATAFRGSIAAILDLSIHRGDVPSAMARLPWWGRLGLPALGGLGVGVLVAFAARRRGGHGVSDVMEAVVAGNVHLSMRLTLLKSAASWLAITTGGSLGREGPLIQFGATAGQTIGGRLSLPPDRVRVLIAAGTAAGFAAAYNTPFAAVLFVLEIVTGVFAAEVVLPTLVAVVIATAATRAAMGDQPLYGVRTFALHSPLELFAFGMLGVVAALAAQGFMRLLAHAEEWFAHPFFRTPWRPALGGLICGSLLILIPEVAGNGYEPLDALIDGRYAVGFVAVLLIAKCIATTASVSSGSPGGVFTPTMLIGGAVGFLYGTILSWVFGAHVGAAGGYALVGMAATTAASTHAPLMAAVLGFELSGDYAIVLPLVLATAVAMAVSRRLRHDSVYTAELHRRGIRWRLTLDGRRIVE